MAASQPAFIPIAILPYLIHDFSRLLESITMFAPLTLPYDGLHVHTRNQLETTVLGLLQVVGQGIDRHFLC